MDKHHHDLSFDFPEFKEKIHDLKISDQHFSKLCNQYETLSKAIHRAENRIDLLSEEDEEKLRKERVGLKDQIYSILSA